MKFNIICNFKLKWWVRPLITATKIYVNVTCKQIDIDRLADFVGRRGIKKQFMTQGI